MPSATPVAAWKSAPPMLAAALAVLLGAGAPASAQGVVRATHGNWQIRCDQPPGLAVEQCALMQSVTAEDRNNIGLTVIVLKTREGEEGADGRLMRVLAPLGVLLPSGLGLFVDEEDLGKAGFVRCLPNGCVAEVVMDDALVARMGAGEEATFIVFQTPEEGIGIPIGLQGFNEGFNALP